MMASQVCANCNELYVDGDRFCGNCGSNLTEQEQRNEEIKKSVVTPPGPVSSRSSESASSPMPVLALLLLFAAIAIAGAWSLSNNHMDEQRVSSSDNYSEPSTSDRSSESEPPEQTTDSSPEIGGDEEKARDTARLSTPITEDDSVLTTPSEGGVATSGGWIGVKIQNITEDIALSRGLNEARGALVTEVIAGGPASDKGIKSGDIVLRVGDAPVANAKDLADAVNRTSPGSVVLLYIDRDGGKRFAAVKTATRPADSVPQSDKELSGQESDKKKPDVERFLKDLPKDSPFREFFEDFEQRQTR